MKFNDLANSRYSVRKYSDREIENEKIEQILETARKAPSAVNFQPYKLFVIKSEGKLAEIKSCYHRTWLSNVKVIIAVVGLHQMGWKRAEDGKDYTDVDVAIMIDHLMLQATELGLGTCWICNFDVALINETLPLQPKEEVVALIPIGYPDSDEIPVKKRKSIDELVVWV